MKIHGEFVGYDMLPILLEYRTCRASTMKRDVTHESLPLLSLSDGRWKGEKEHIVLKLSGISKLL